jgi:hypothetical protein
MNQGSKSATGVQLSAMLPPQLKPIDGEGPTHCRVSGSQVDFEPIAKLAPKADTTFRVRAQATAAGDARVRVQITTDELKTPVTKEESTRIYSEE